MSEIKVNSIKGVGASAAAITVNNTDGTCTANITNNLSNRNKIVNGSMICSQRGSSFTSDGYILDRFKRSQSSDGAFTVTQSTTSPDGFAKSLKVDVTTADTSLAAGQYAQIIQKIEAQNLQDLAYGTSSAKNIVVSFYVRSNKTGNYSFNIQQNDNSSKQVTLNYTINSANTWERKTFSIAGDTSGVINDDNGSGFQISWGLAYGSTYTSGSARPAWTTYADADFGAGQAINLLDSTSNEWYLTGVQLEVNSSGVATDFEHRSIAVEKRLCMRYYQQYVNLMGAGIVPDNSSRSYNHGFNFPVEFRATPSMTTTNTGSNGGQIVTDGSTNASVSSLLSSLMNTESVHFDFNLSTDLVNYRPAMIGQPQSSTYNTTYKISAEL